MSDVMEISERGRQALRNPDGYKAEHLLCLEVLSRIGGSGDFENVMTLVDQLIDRYGGAEAALVAVKVGHVGFEQIPDNEIAA
jgi:hypothetical protein